MSKQKSLFITLGISILLVILWFACVEKSLYIEGCSDCYYQANVTRYRLLGQTVYTSTEEHNTILRTILQDLGLPCPHNGHFSHYKSKYYGLLILVTKESEPTEIIIGNSSWYTPEAAQKVRQLGKDDPEFAKEFYHQMVDLQNYSCWQQLFQKADLPTLDSRASQQ